MRTACRVSAAMALTGALLCSACAARPAVTTGPAPVAPATRATESTVAPDGSQYAGQIVGSGFTARLYLVRERPSPSGQVTLTVGMAALPGKDSRFGAGLVGATDEELSVSAVTSSGTIGLNGFLMTPGMLKGGGGFAREDFGLALALPPGTTSLRFTVHLGLTKAAARTGASVEVPLSVVPVVSRVLPFKGLTPAFGGGHLATPAVP